MSEYGYDDPPRRQRRSQKVRDYDYDREPEYVTETTYIQRGPGQPSRELVYRGRDDDVESIDRDFPPPRGSRRSEYDYDRGAPRRARSVGRRDYDDDSEYGAPAAGAAAGYAASRGARRGSRYDDGYYSDDNDRPRMKERRKSTIESALEGFGLGGIAGALTGKGNDRSKSRGRNDDYEGDSDRSTRSRRRDKSQDTKKKWQQAATAAILAGAVEAYRGRKDTNKGTRIATAALASAGLDSFLDRNPDEHKKRHVVESVIGGLAATRLANGARSQSRGRNRSPEEGGGQGFFARSKSRLRSLSRGRGRDDSGSRSRSRGRANGGGGGASGLKDIAAIGGVAAVGKAIYDRVRSKSRGRNRSRSDSEDSYVPSRRQRYQADKGRGIDDDQDDRDDRDATSERGRSQHPGSIDDRGIGMGWGPSKKRDDSSDSQSTTDLENQRKKSRGKELLTAGFAAVATIHAAHGVYSSMKASEERHKAVQSGEITKEQARKQKSKNMLQDAAAVGIAALGIKGAFSEWKEMNETRHEVKELEEKRRKKKKRRDQREKEQRQVGFMNPYGPYGGAPMPSYGDSNPYAVGNLPPPPMGGPARY